MLKSDKVVLEYAFNLATPPDQVHRPIILDQDRDESPYAPNEEVEEDLSLEANEKNLIRKALKKHNNRRKEAASELRISERTLYRKIKQYELQ